MERAFLTRLDHQLFIAPATYASTYFELCSLVPSSEEALRRQLYRMTELAGACFVLVMRGYINMSATHSVRHQQAPLQLNSTPPHPHITKQLRRQRPRRAPAAAARRVAPGQPDGGGHRAAPPRRPLPPPPRGRRRAGVQHRRGDIFRGGGGVVGYGWGGGRGKDGAGFYILVVDCLSVGRSAVGCEAGSCESLAQEWPRPFEGGVECVY